MTERECELVQRLTDTLERMRLDEYLEYVSNRKRMIASSLLYGMVRGLGFAVGFSVLGALAIVLMKDIVLKNIPFISDFIAEVIHAIETRM